MASSCLCAPPQRGRPFYSLFAIRYSLFATRYSPLRSSYIAFHTCSDSSANASASFSKPASAQLGEQVGKAREGKGRGVGAHERNGGKRGLAIGVLVGCGGDAGDGGVGNAAAGCLLGREQCTLVRREAAARAGEEEEHARVLDAAQVELARGGRGGGAGCGGGRRIRCFRRRRKGGDEAVEELAGLSGIGAGEGEHQVEAGGRPGVRRFIDLFSPVAGGLGVADGKGGAGEGLGVGESLFFGSALMASARAREARRKSAWVSVLLSAAAIGGRPFVRLGAGVVCGDEREREEIYPWRGALLAARRRCCRRLSLLP